ncbi:hypothetical protein LCGC14_2179380 [marine sediment metagenome]|uniref:Uncharacterized protein n=1 Tax=marine sediment metagenome TaxID=412755 RepID=A0A0F9GIL4_9ZZZZ
MNERELFTPLPVPVPLPLPVPVTSERNPVRRYGLDYSGTYSNSQFFVSIFNLTKKLALWHFMMEKGA